jgi:hypothetical protein
MRIHGEINCLGGESVGRDGKHSCLFYQTSFDLKIEWRFNGFSLEGHENGLNVRTKLFTQISSEIGTVTLIEVARDLLPLLSNHGSCGDIGAIDCGSLLLSIS